MYSCLWCGQAFQPKDMKHLDRNPPKYCSRQCAARHRVSLQPKPILQSFRCEQCGESFVPEDQSPSHLRRNPPTYCSRSCRDEARRTRVTLTCRQCGQEFRRKAYMADWSQERGPFCSFRCYGAWQQEHTAGELNPNFRPESSRRGSGQWERNRLLVLDRDGHRCADCGSTHRLHVHHLREWDQNDPSTHELNNLLTVCASCHRRRHPMKRAADGKLMSNR